MTMIMIMIVVSPLLCRGCAEVDHALAPASLQLCTWGPRLYRQIMPPLFFGRHLQQRDRMSFFDGYTIVDRDDDTWHPIGVPYLEGVRRQHIHGIFDTTMMCGWGHSRASLGTTCTLGRDFTVLICFSPFALCMAYIPGRDFIVVLWFSPLVLARHFMHAKRT